MFLLNVSPLNSGDYDSVSNSLDSMSGRKRSNEETMIETSKRAASLISERTCTHSPAAEAFVQKITQLIPKGAEVEARDITEEFFKTTGRRPRPALDFIAEIPNQYNRKRPIPIVTDISSAQVERNYGSAIAPKY